MSDVVLRCPNCGTTQASAGECEACHEGNVRYYCPNHTPGRWLDGPTCAECEAREARERVAARGRTVPPMKPMPPVSPPRTPPPTRDVPRDTPRDMPSSSPRGAPPERPSTWPARDVPPAVPRPGSPRRFPRPWERAKTTHRDDEGVWMEPRDPRDPRDVGRTEYPGAPPDWRAELPPMVSIRALPAAIGCLKRLLILALIGGILFALASAWFFGSVFIGAGDDNERRDERAASLRLADVQQVAPWRSPSRHVAWTGGWALRGDDGREASSTLAVA